MKRTDLRPGEEYVTSYGAHIRIVDLDTGWLLKAGKWCRDGRMGTRLKPGRDGQAYQRYPLNPNVRCIVIDQTGHETKGVVRPQLVVSTWSDYLNTRREIERNRKDEKRQVKRWQSTLRGAGIKHATVDVIHGTVTVPLTEIAHQVGAEVQAS